MKRIFALSALLFALLPWAFAQEPLIWTDLVNCLAGGNDVMKSGPYGYSNGGAASFQSVTPGEDGYVEFTHKDVSATFFFGASADNPNTSWSTIDYAIYFWGTSAYIYENGAYRYWMGTGAQNDVYRIERNNGVVTYQRNGAVIYTSSVTSAQGFRADVTIVYTGNTIDDAMFFDASAQGEGEGPACPRPLDDAEICEQDLQLRAVNAFDAYPITATPLNFTPTQEVIIAVIDNAFYLSHEDLRENWYINEAEIPSTMVATLDADNDGAVTSGEIYDWIVAENDDHNGDGRVDLQDALQAGSPLTDGIDDDGDGMVDNILGWDASGDGSLNSPTTPDNDPSQRAGSHLYGDCLASRSHGTGVTMVASSQTDNAMGV
ncbi:MAG: hypothetical protein AAF570_21220, partial [Bacteroidota bacterium]